MLVRMMKIDEIRGVQRKCIELYRAYGERHFLQNNEVARNFHHTFLYVL